MVPEESQAQTGLAGPGAAHQAHLLPGQDRQVETGQYGGQLGTVRCRVLFELYLPLLRPALPIDESFIVLLVVKHQRVR